MNPSTLWPTWMEDRTNPEHMLLAKSADFGGDTLAKHTWDVLSRLSDQLRLRPNLPELAGERVWARMFWGCFLHDFGKAAVGFQNILRKRADTWGERRHRHEILSLAFVDWLFPKGHPDREWIIAVIAFHHKDAEEVFGKYGGKVATHQMQPNDLESVQMMLNELAAHIAPDTRVQLWRWIDECALAWADTLGFQLSDIPQLLPLEQAQTTQFPKAIFRALRDFTEWSKQLNEAQKAIAMLYRGLILTSDHAASAGTPEFPTMPLTMTLAEAPLRKLEAENPQFERGEHQKKAKTAPIGSAIMIAPTGSGKTEAAMIWAARQHELCETARIFYTLPYQASMNAMYERLGIRFLGMSKKDLSTANNQIAIYHARALLKIYQDLMNVDEQPKTAKNMAKRIKNLARLNFFPIQVFSPYQMLKAAYGLKGYETMLVDYTDALFIFDEIHAYEASRLALIVSMIQWLSEHYRARFLVMTATLPPMIDQALRSALHLTQNEQIITASDADYDKSKRHMVKILDGNLLDQIVPLVQQNLVENQAVLVCCNLVAEAQQVYSLLQNELGLTPDEQIVLVHSRFNGYDRAAKEQLIRQRVGVPRDPNRPPIVVVATQVVEVSLDIDLDTLYTDPAPLEAMLQRFGRVNRGRGAGAPLKTVHVFREPSNPNPERESSYIPYDDVLVKRSVEILDEFTCHDSRVDESKVATMLAQIYAEGSELRKQWQAEYDRIRRDFEDNRLKNKPLFESADKKDQQDFYRLFDGIEVLPQNLVDIYYSALEQRGYLEASGYLVNISHKQYHEFDGYELIGHARELEGGYADHIMIDYDSNSGLDLDRARQNYRAQKEVNDE